MSKSLKRVEQAARDAGFALKIHTMPDSTRTADDAAKACNCQIGQITKSLIFEGVSSGNLILLLVSGDHNVDLKKASEQIGETLCRADPKIVREKTGFAIGGVAPIGHLAPIDTWMDAHLLDFETIWAAAGTPRAVFELTPGMLQALTSAKVTSSLTE